MTIKKDHKLIGLILGPEINNSGGTLVLITVILVLLISIGGFAIDTNIAATSQSEQQRTAEFVALGALKKFLSTEGDYLAKLEAARSWAEEIAELNVHLGAGFQQNPGLPEQIGTTSSSSPEPNTGLIAPGVWHKLSPSECTGLPRPCPCEGGISRTPCFEEINLDTSPDAVDRVNAFRAHLNLHRDSPIRSTFAKLFGGRTSFITSAATATTNQKRGVFLIDVSRLAQAETHLRYETHSTGPTGGHTLTLSSEYAFKLDPNIHDSCPLSNPPCPIAGGLGQPKKDGGCAFSGGMYPEMFDMIYNYDDPYTIMPDARLPGANPEDLVRHFRGDYQCVEVNYKDGESEKITDNYIVDLWRGPALPTDYLGPEPLNSMLYALNQALTIAEEERAPDTRIGAIFFDRSAAIDIRRFEPVAWSDQKFARLKQVTAIDDLSDETLKLRHAEHFIFPRAEGGSDYVAAFKGAHEMLKGIAGMETAENFIVLITAGLPHCADGLCEFSFGSFKDSIDEALGYAANELKNDSIRLHVVLINNWFAPHTMLHQSTMDSARCMDEQEARLQNPPLPFVDGSGGEDEFREALYETLFGLYFAGANRLYEGVVATDGLWLPVRRCCMIGISCGDVRDELNDACANADSTISDYVVATPMTDNDGRLICDPRGRDRKEQLVSHMREVLATPIYSLVE